MTDWVHTVVQWPLSLSVFAIVALSVSAALLSVRWARRFWPHPAFKENHELVGFTYSVYGVIYGVFLAFIIIIGWERYADTEQLVMHETTILSEIWRDSMAFPPPLRGYIHKDLLEYTQSVLDDEWPEMAARGQSHPHTEEVYERLWALTYQINPKTENQKAYLSELLMRMNELSGDRRLRMLHSRMHINSVLWLVLLVGAIPTVVYPLLFSSKHAWVQVAIMTCIMSIVLLALLVTLNLQHPFSGVAGIKPGAFRELQDSFNKRLLTESISVGA